MVKMEGGPIRPTITETGTRADVAVNRVVDSKVELDVVEGEEASTEVGAANLEARLVVLHQLPHEFTAL